MYGLLGVLEGYAASLYINRITQQDIDHLGYYYEQMEKVIETDTINACYSHQNMFPNIYEPVDLLCFGPISTLYDKNNPRNINYMPVVIFFVCLGLEPNS